MRLHLLDTTPLAGLLNSRPALVSFLTPFIVRDELATSILAYAEVIEWLKGAADFSRRRAHLRRMLHGVRPYPVTHATAERYADIRRQLRSPHGPGLIGDMDMLIAATALTHNLELISTDSDFLRVPGLSVLLLDRRTFQPLVR